MKIKSLLIGMLACSAMVACTNTDEPEVDNGNENGKKYYAAVNLAMPGNSSRAADFNGFADGTPQENEVKDVTFFFLDANGYSCADAFYLSKGLTSNDNTEDDKTTGEGDDAVKTLGSFDEKTSTVIVLENPTEIPSSIVAVINVGYITAPTDGKLSSRPSLSQIQAVVDNYATATWNAMPSTGMVMSNTAYMDVNGQVVIGAPVSAENIITNGDFEKGETYNGNVKPVTIYVEKALAKVNVTGQTTATQTNTAINLISPTSTTTGTGDDAVTTTGTASASKTLTVAIDGWWLDSAPQKSLLLKDIENYTYSWDWNDVANYRSYWANSYADDDQAYTNYKYSTGAANKIALYCQENTEDATTVTTQDKDVNDNTYEVNNRTKVVVAATLKDGNNAVDLVKWYGKYYTKGAFLTTFANLNDVKKYYTRTGEGTKASPYVYTTLSASQLDLFSNKDKQDATNGEIAGTDQLNETVKDSDGKDVAIRNYEAVVKLKGVTELFKKGAQGMEEVSSLDTVNEELKSISKVMYWANGKTYYYVELEHHDGYFGVVRNHLYNVNLTAISGLGTPVPNTEKIIIPEKPGDSDMNTYISANVVIMSYRIVNQNVTLQ